MSKGTKGRCKKTSKNLVAVSKGTKGRCKVYTWIKTGKLRAIKIGRLVRIPHTAIAEMMEGATKDDAKSIAYLRRATVYNIRATCRPALT